jgi:cobalamin biosynthesis Mg chelatase CobN
VGTAALLNVPASLQALLQELVKEGYNLGENADALDGEAIVAALKVSAVHAVLLQCYIIQCLL